MKPLKITGIILLAVTLAVLCINIFITRLPDWAVRIDGIIMIISLFLVPFTALKKH